MTAHDVVGRVRRITGIKQVGHAGTLDPMATGVLPIAIGKSCRLLRFLQDDKVYRAGILFGQSTDTDDIEGKVISTSEVIPSLAQIEEALPSFTGKISQRPPAYSAVHIDGERLYKLARKGELPAEIPLRHVTVFSIEQLSFTDSVLELRIHCSTGTYIRSIARDLGEKLGTVACLCSLERERAGGFAVDASAELEKLAEADAFVQKLIAPETKIDLPLLELDADEYRRLGFGQIVSLNLSRLQNVGSDDPNIFNAAQLRRDSDSANAVSVSLNADSGSSNANSHASNADSDSSSTNSDSSNANSHTSNADSDSSSADSDSLNANSHASNANSDSSDADSDSDSSNSKEYFCKVMFASKLVAICRLMVQTANECSIKPEVVLTDGRTD